MPKTIIIGTDSFDVPLQGDNPDYGESLTDLFEAIADALETVQQPNDILTQSGTIANNITVATSIPNFSFDTAEVQSINAEYIIKRTTAVPANNLVESGFIEGNFDGTNWSISRRQIGDAGVEFTVTSGGQIQYTSTDVSGTSYTGEISFKAKVFNQA